MASLVSPFGFATTSQNRSRSPSVSHHRRITTAPVPSMASQSQPTPKTLVEFNLLEVRDEWVLFEGNNDATALSNAGNMQIRFVVPASLVGRDINGNFDLS